MCEKLERDYPNISVWMVSKVSLDTSTAPNYICTPVPFRINLAKSTLVQNTDGAEMMPCVLVPPRTVAEVARITTNKPTNSLAVVKQVCKEKPHKTGLDIEHVHLLDESLKS